MQWKESLATATQSYFVYEIDICMTPWSTTGFSTLSMTEDIYPGHFFSLRPLEAVVSCHFLIWSLMISQYVWVSCDNLRQQKQEGRDKQLSLFTVVLYVIPSMPYFSILLKYLYQKRVYIVCLLLIQCLSMCLSLVFKDKSQGCNSFFPLIRTSWWCRGSHFKSCFCYNTIFNEWLDIYSFSVTLMSRKGWRCL